MTKTFRNRRQCPKGLKVRDGKPWACFDEKNIEYWFDNHAHKKTVWRKFNPIEWMPGRAYTNNKSPIEFFYVAFFKENKIRVEAHYVKSFKHNCGSRPRRNRLGKRFETKKIRKKIQVNIKKEKWEKIPIIIQKCKKIYY